MSDFTTQIEASIAVTGLSSIPLPPLRSFETDYGDTVYETRLYQLYEQWFAGQATLDHIFDVLIPVLDGTVDVDDVMYIYKHVDNDELREKIAIKVLSDGNNKFFWAIHLVTKRTICQSRSVYVLQDFMSKATSGNDYEEVQDWLIEKLELRRCDDCDEYEFADNTVTPHNSSRDICRACIDNNYTYSDYYEDYIYREDARDAVDNNGDDCTITYDDPDFTYNHERERYEHDDFEHEEEIIGGYHSSKSRVRKQFDDWTNANKRFIGVELEVETNSCDSCSKASELNDAINGGEIGNKVFFERDGSLSNGFEIITQPMSLPAQLKLWSFLKDPSRTKGLLSHNTNTCGLHVHVSRAYMSSLQVAKIVTFISNPDNEGLIRAVARRYAQGYCKIVAKKMGESIKSRDRYEAVNITPRETIEFRIFKGSLKYESVIAAIEFANAVVEFAKPTNTSIKELTSEKFIEFINTKMAKDTEHLRPYIANRLENA